MDGIIFCSWVLSKCQTADYLRRKHLPHTAVMMRIHIISGQTADYRGLISVQQKPD